MLKIQVLAWDRHISVAELSRLMGSQPSLHDSYISNGNTYTMYKQMIKKTCTNALSVVISQDIFPTAVFTIVLHKSIN